MGTSNSTVRPFSSRSSSRLTPRRRLRRPSWDSAPDRAHARAYPAAGCAGRHRAAWSPSRRPPPASAAALSTPSLLAALTGAAPPRGSRALPRLALGPSPPPRRVPTEAGLGALRSGSAADRAGHVQPAWCSTRRRTRCSGSDTRHPARPRLDRQAAHDGGRAAHAQPDPELVTRWWRAARPGAVVLVGGGDPTLTALPAGQAGVYPDPARLTDLAAQVKKATGGAVPGRDRHEPLPRPGPRAGLGRRATSRAATSRPSPRHARRRPRRPHPAGRRAASPTPPSRPGWRSPSCSGLGKSRGDHGHRPGRRQGARRGASPRRSPSSSSTLLQTSDNVLAEVLARRSPSPAAASRRSTARWRRPWRR